MGVRITESPALALVENSVAAFGMHNSNFVEPDVAFEITIDVGAPAFVTWNREIGLGVPIPKLPFISTTILSVSTPATSVVKVKSWFVLLFWPNNHSLIPLPLYKWYLASPVLTILIAPCVADPTTKHLLLLILPLILADAPLIIKDPIVLILPVAINLVVFKRVPAVNVVI